MLCFQSWVWIVLGIATGRVVWAQSGANDDIKSVPLRTHSLKQPYLDSNMQNRWFDFGGNTLVRSDKYVRLAANRPSQDGWLFSRVPLTATNWEIEFEYKISGVGNLYGDGFAMWLTKQRGTPGSVFGSTDMFEGLGIFFDTYKNNRPGVAFPYVMAMIGDGKTPYDKANDGKANEVAGCSVRSIRNLNYPTKARLTYFQDQNLRLDLLYKENGQWDNCFDVADVKIPSVAYLGFSAETGELSDNFDIIDVESRNLYKTGGASGGRKLDNERTKLKGQKKQNQGAKSGTGSWSWFFFKVVLFCMLAGAAYVGWTFYRTSQSKSRF